MSLCICWFIVCGSCVGTLPMWVDVMLPYVIHDQVMQTHIRHCNLVKDIGGDSGPFTCTFYSFSRWLVVCGFVLAVKSWPASLNIADLEVKSGSSKCYRKMAVAINLFGISVGGDKHSRISGKGSSRQRNMPVKPEVPVFGQSRQWPAVPLVDNYGVHLRDCCNYHSHLELLACQSPMPLPLPPCIQTSG